MGSALVGDGSILEPAGIGSIGHSGSFQQLLTEATPVSPPLPPPCRTNPVHAGRKGKHCLQRSYEVSLKPSPRRMLLKYIWCIYILFMDVFWCLSWSHGARQGYLISEVTGSTTASCMWGFTQVTPAPASFFFPK